MRLPSRTGRPVALGQVSALLAGSGKCIDTPQSNFASGTKEQIDTCNGTTNQEWTFGLNGSIVGTGSGLCLNVVNYGTTNGSTLQLWTCEDTTNEQWSW